MYTGKYPRWFTDNALGLRPRALSETTSRIFPVYTGYLGYNLYMYSIFALSTVLVCMCIGDLVFYCAEFIVPVKWAVGIVHFSKMLREVAVLIAWRTICIYACVKMWYVIFTIHGYIPVDHLPKECHIMHTH